MAGGRVYDGSSMTETLQNERIPCSTDSLEAILISGSSPRIHGKRSMINFEDARSTPGRSLYQPLDQEEAGDEDLGESFHQAEKKRRLTADQVQLLERSFEVENKLEPERKLQLAIELGVHPRQIAIWFQNRRARWKTKQLEKDYEALKASYDSLKVDYENVLMEKDKLKSVEELSSATSAVYDSDSPPYVIGGHSSLLEPAASSNIFEADHSDVSPPEEEEEDDLNKSLQPPDYHFLKLEEAVYPDPPQPHVIMHSQLRIKALVLAILRDVHAV